MAEHEKMMARQSQKSDRQSLVAVLESVLDDKDDTLPCLACHL
ncbi:hypothetical protein [Egbenema bharatensis]